MDSPFRSDGKGADFSSASSLSNTLGAFFCNFPNRDLCHSRGSAARAAHGQPPYQILWVRGFRGHTISGRGFNLFKPLRRHFPATPVLPSSPLAPRSGGPKRLGSKDRQSDRRSAPGRPWELRYFSRQARLADASIRKATRRTGVSGAPQKRGRAASWIPAFAGTTSSRTFCSPGPIQTARCAPTRRARERRVGKLA
jgi:hypothetical protein